MWFASKTSTIEEQLLELLRASLPRAWRKRELSLDMGLAELGLDSLAVLLIITEFCERHQIELETVQASAEPIRTVGQLVGAGRAILEQRGGTDG